MLEVGSILNGNYKILNEIGHGGMSVVYLALNERANKTWDVKEVRKDGSNNSEIVSQGLIAETEMLKKLKHPHLPSIIDVVDKDDSFIIVMDYIEGRSLQSLINHSGPQDPELVLEWSKQLCDVLGYLHSRTPPIIYRDMKPANVMLKPNGDITLIDFGTAREYKENSEGDTTCLGTRGYAAPEQFGGRGQTDGRTDIYNLGATMYHLLTGYSPADTHFEILPLGSLNPAFAGSGLEKVVAKCCAANPADRYQSCPELMYALEHVHDEDDVARRARSHKWRKFVASIIVAAVGAAAAVGFAVVGNSAKAESYETYLEQAASSADFKSAASYFEKAIEIRPTVADAYMQMLSVIDGDLTFTIEENNALFEILNSYGGTSRSNVSRFQSSDPEKYAEFAYRLANDYYFFYSGSDNRTKAANWYSTVMDSKYLTEQERTLAKSLNAIGNYYATLDKHGSDYSLGDNSQTYKTLWDQLAEMTDGDVMVKTGGTRYAVALYYEFVNQIAIHANDFRAYGITKNDMNAQLAKMEDGMKTFVPESDNIRAKISDTETRLAQAKEMVEAAFEVVSGTTGGE